MAVREYDDGGKRFYVIDVRGWTIGAEGRTAGRAATSSYAVLDRDDMHLEVAIFTPGLGNGYSRYQCKWKAETLAARLNAEVAE